MIWVSSRPVPKIPRLPEGYTWGMSVLARKQGAVRQHVVGFGRTVCTRSAATTNVAEGRFCPLCVAWVNGYWMQEEDEL